MNKLTKIAIPATVMMMALLSSCSSHDQRSEGRQDQRIESRAEDDYEKRRGKWGDDNK